MNSASSALNVVEYSQPATSQVEVASFGCISVCVHDCFEGAEASWRTLEQTGIGSVYQRFDWVQRWACQTSNGLKMTPRIVVGTRGDELLFVLPLGLQRRGGLAVAGWLADSHSNFQMGLFAPRFMEAVCAEDMQVLVKEIIQVMGSVHLLELCCQPESWNGYVNPFSYLSGQESPNHAFALKLDGSFREILDRKNGSRKRKKHRWQKNQLAAVGGHKLRIASTPQEVNDFLDVTFEQMARRFKRTGVWNRFQDPGIADFMREMALNSLGEQEPALMIYGLEIDNALRATFAGGIRQGHFSGCFLSLAEDEYARLSPGELLIYRVIEDCVERGLKVFDLGRGEERYKSSWCDSVIPMFETYIAVSPRGVALSAYRKAAVSSKRTIKRNDTLWNLAKKLRAGVYGSDES